MAEMVEKCVGVVGVEWPFSRHPHAAASLASTGFQALCVGVVGVSLPSMEKMKREEKEGEKGKESSQPPLPPRICTKFIWNSVLRAWGVPKNPHSTPTTPTRSTRCP